MIKKVNYGILVINWVLANNKAFLLVGYDSQCPMEVKNFPTQI